MGDKKPPPGGLLRTIRLCGRYLRAIPTTATMTMTSAARLSAANGHSRNCFRKRLDSVFKVNEPQSNHEYQGVDSSWNSIITKMIATKVKAISARIRPTRPALTGSIFITVTELVS